MPECRLADRVINDCYAGADGDFSNALGETFGSVDNRMVAAMGPRDFGLGLIADRPDHRRSQLLGPLAHDQTDPARRGVDQDHVAAFHRVGFAQQITRCHAADHHRRRCAFVDGVGQRHHARGWHQPRFGVSAVWTRHARDALANLEIRHLRADAGAERIDHARAFKPDAGWQRLQRMPAVAYQDVAEVESDRGVAQADLSRTGSANLDILPAHHLGSAGLVNAERFCHAAGFLAIVFR